MPVGVEQVEVVAAHSQVDGVLDVGDLVAEEEVRRVEEGTVLASINPDGAGLRIQNVKGVVVQDERGDASPVRVGEGRQREDLRHLPGRAIQQVAGRVYAEDACADRVDLGQGEDVHDGADLIAAVRAGLAVEGGVIFQAPDR
jgi:hypothetical protein